MVLIFKNLNQDDCKKLLPELLNIGRDLEWDTWNKENFIMDMPHKWELSFTCWINDLIVAYAIISKKQEEQMYIHRFMIDERFRGKGLGKKIIEFILKNKAESIKEISLRVHQKNTLAQEFYKKMDFISVGRIDDDLIMLKPIDSLNIGNVRYDINTELK